jgi:hypothetical protein
MLPRLEHEVPARRRERCPTREPSYRYLRCIASCSTLLRQIAEGLRRAVYALAVPRETERRKPRVVSLVGRDSELRHNNNMISVR